MSQLMVRVFDINFFNQEHGFLTEMAAIVSILLFENLKLPSVKNNYNNSAR